MIPKIVASQDPPRVPTIRVTSRQERRICVDRVQRKTLDTRPCFTSSWIEDLEAVDAVAIERRVIHGVPVSIASITGSSRGLYIVDPPEYRLNPIHIQILTESIEEIVRTIPEDFEIQSLATVRPHIMARAKDSVYAKLAERSQEMKQASELEKEAEDLAGILCKYTAGFGALETLLDDPAVQDIYVDAPSSQNAVHVVLRSDKNRLVRQKCRTNVFVGRRDLMGFVSRIKFETGLPFSEAHPVLEADMKRLGSRVTLVGPPLSDKGVAIAIRKHSEGLWPLHLLVSNDCLSPLLSSFLWACVVGRRTVLIAGSRGAGKTTLLGSLMLEFPMTQRILLIEDTPEIPYRRLQDLGYDVQALRFTDSDDRRRSSAEDSLRVSLRMGESAIIIGEVRGSEARVLYESMRAGSAGSSVLGTIHGNSGKGVLDRAVEDLSVSERAFSSTDLIVVMGMIRSPDGTRFSRRVTEVCEVLQGEEGLELVPLFLPASGCSCAKPTERFTSRSKTIAGIADALGIGQEETLDLVKARAHADQVVADELKSKPENAAVRRDEFRVRSNEVLNRCLFGSAGPEVGLREWKEWFDEAR